MPFANAHTITYIQYIDYTPFFYLHFSYVSVWKSIVSCSILNACDRVSVCMWFVFFFCYLLSIFHKPFQMKISFLALWTNVFLPNRIYERAAGDVKTKKRTDLIAAGLCILFSKSIYCFAVVFWKFRLQIIANKPSHLRLRKFTAERLRETIFCKKHYAIFNII